MLQIWPAYVKGRNLTAGVPITVQTSPFATKVRSRPKSEGRQDAGLFPARCRPLFFMRASQAGVIQPAARMPQRETPAGQGCHKLGPARMAGFER
jgi:hypothetical protein